MDKKINFLHPEKSLLSGLLVMFLLVMPLGGISGNAEADLPEESTGPLVPVLDLPELEEGSVIQIPVGQDSMKISLPPAEDRYICDPVTGEVTGYADPSITVNMGKGRIYETDYLYARVKIADASQLRTVLSSPMGNLNITPGHDLARRVQAVVAINGDYCGGGNISAGAFMRQGKMLRLKCSGKSDVLVIDVNGDFQILENARTEEVKKIQAQAVQMFTFGPALVVDGKAKYGYKSSHMATYAPAQRTALCQTGPLEYLLITSEGPDNEGSTGLTIDQFVDLLSSMPEIQTAYNLDGGSSSTMVFRMDDSCWKKVNALSNPKVRELKDIIYFATAWDRPLSDRQ